MLLPASDNSLEDEPHTHRGNSRPLHFKIAVWSKMFIIFSYSVLSNLYEIGSRPLAVVNRNIDDHNLRYLTLDRMFLKSILTTMRLDVIKY